VNLLLWVLQGILALFSLAGGGYKLFAYQELAKTPAAAALSRAAWGAIGLFEMACAVLLILPLALRWNPMLTPLAAVLLLVESLALAAVYARYSLAFEAANPLVWVMLMAVLAVVVAYGRYSR
jgi:hypothetical protein